MTHQEIHDLIEKEFWEGIDAINACKTMDELKAAKTKYVIGMPKIWATYQKKLSFIYRLLDFIFGGESDLQIKINRITLQDAWDIRYYELTKL